MDGNNFYHRLLLSLWSEPFTTYYSVALLEKNVSPREKVWSVGLLCLTHNDSYFSEISRQLKKIKKQIMTKITKIHTKISFFRQTCEG